MDSQKKGPLRISDLSLTSTRDSLLELFDAHWPFVVLQLENLTLAEDVSAALAPTSFDDSLYVMRLLLREDFDIDSVKETRTCERRLRTLQKVLQNHEQKIAVTTEHLRQVKPPPNPKEPNKSADEPKIEEHEHSAQELEILRSEEMRLNQILGEGQSHQTQLREEHAQLKMQLEASRASFAKSELVRFCRSYRNRLNPRRIANALAGLPFVGWRQSAKRCIQLETSKAPGRYRYFLTRLIRRLVYSWDRKSDLCTHFETRLRGSARSPVGLWKELGSNWRQLRKAIELTVDDLYTESRSSAIASKYIHLVMQPKSQREATLTRLQRIDVKLKSRKKQSGSSPVSADNKP
jgi:hypothetical protein